jgi:hypothetical protein
MEVIDNKDDLGALRKLVAGAVSQGKADELLAEVGAVIVVSKDAGKKLGVILLGMRDDLRKKKKLGAVIAQVATLTGFSTKTIRRWIDPKAVAEPVAEMDKMSNVPNKKDFDGGAEIKSLATRLASKDYAFIDAAEQFVGRMLEKTGVPSDASGDAEFIECMRGLVEVLAETRGMKVCVTITEAAVELGEAA